MALNLFANKADLEAAQSQIASLEADLQTSQAELQAEREASATQAQTIAELQASVATLTAERDSANESVSALTAERDNLTQQLTQAQASAETRAAEILAQAGVPPVADANDKISMNVKTLTEFNALTPAGRMSFLKKGGKISN